MAKSDLSWQDDALCLQVGGEPFFPPKGDNATQARKVCEQCDVRPQCLEYALETDQRYGVWGGATEMERRKIRKDRRKGHASG